MDKKLLNSPQTKINVMDSLLAEMVLDQVILNFKKEQIQKKIDQSLLERNKSEFLRLTEELKKIS
ncbi:IDEAL domain-containing protein [Mesobacillus maritimus]|uniref:IDEAL domain-containing protein n=1 Tax=Mesobacillus maritimus TaxID=1643336 RepID=UPI00203F2190|nr:IDEAL domain-containing protein [Mesobacillus maritimus]MCM3587526.1 IDEAL domain-containing protein [Mesobacillus maritimus]MCM3671172.1 IDEAL domain-containing protein [Mesobacillus maritimus]